MKLKGINPAERYVEKAVLAVAVAAAAYFAYANFVQTPIKVNFNNTDVAPTQVEAKVSDAVSRVDNQAHSPELLAALANAKVPSYVGEYVEEQKQPVPKNDLAPMPRIGPRNLPATGGEGNNPNTLVVLPLTIPDLPAPTGVSADSQRNVIALGVAPLPAPGGGGGGPPPGAFPPNMPPPGFNPGGYSRDGRPNGFGNGGGYPGQPGDGRNPTGGTGGAPPPAPAAPVVPGTPAPAGTKTVDASYVRIVADRPDLQPVLSAAFDVPQSPLGAAARKLTFKEFQVQRIERDLNNAWPDPTNDANWQDVKPLPITQIPVLPGHNGDLKGITNDDIQGILAALTAAAPDLLTPAFYPLVTFAAPPTPAGPATPTPTRRTSSAGPGGGSITGLGPNTGNLAGIAGQAIRRNQPTPQQPQPNATPPAAPTMTLSAATQPDPTAKVWKFDMDVKPNHEYRYRVRFAIFNPTFNTKPANQLPYSVIPPAEKDQPWLYTPWTPLDQPVTIQSDMYFFAAENFNNKPVPIDIYKWIGGFWYKLEVKDVAPGEPIAGVKVFRSIDAAGKPVVTQLPLDTGYVMVDVRYQPDGDKILTLLNPNGQLEQRRVSTDKADPLHRQLDDETRDEPKTPPVGLVSAK
jgi:hypothetical protein